MTEYPVHITDTPIFTNIFINVIPHPALTLDSIRSLSHTVYMLISITIPYPTCTEIYETVIFKTSRFVLSQVTIPLIVPQTQCPSLDIILPYNITVHHTF